MDETLARFWSNLLDRVGGPMSFRLVMQPAMAIVLASLAGRADARAGRPAYLWALFTHPFERSAMLREGWKAVANVFVVAVVVDAVYQFIALGWFYPGEALAVAFTLACVPYVLVRGPVNRALRLRLRHRTSGPPRR